MLMGMKVSGEGRSAAEPAAPRAAATAVCPLCAGAALPKVCPGGRLGQSPLHARINHVNVSLGEYEGEKKSKYVCIYPEQCCWYRWVTCFPSLLSLPPRKPKRSVGSCSPASLQGKIWGSSKHPGQWREQGCCLPQQDVIQDDAVHGDAP